MGRKQKLQNEKQANFKLNPKMNVKIEFVQGNLLVLQQEWNCRMCEEKPILVV